VLNQPVRKREPVRCIGNVFDERGPPGRVENVQELILAQVADLLEQLEVEFAPDHCGEAEHAQCWLSEAGHTRTRWS